MIRDLICTLFVAASVVVLLVFGWPSDQTASQREAFLRERLELTEAKLVECERLRSMTSEIPGRVSELLDDLDRAIGRMP